MVLSSKQGRPVLGQHIMNLQEVTDRSIDLKWSVTEIFPYRTEKWSLKRMCVEERFFSVSLKRYVFPDLLVSLYKRER